MPFGKLEEIANEIEQVLQNDMDREIPSAKIGELVMDRLREVDEVAMSASRRCTGSLRTSAPL